jgi:hypothetical protein
VLSTSSAAECEALDVVWARRQIDSAVTAAGETVATLWDEVGPPPPLPSLLRLLSLRTLQGCTRRRWECVSVIWPRHSAYKRLCRDITVPREADFEML